MRLTQRLFLLVLIALLPALAIQAYNEFDLRRTRQAEVDEMALRQAQLASSELNQIFEGIHNLLIAVAEVPSVRSFAAEECAAYLATLQPKVPYLKTIAAIDMEGRVVCRQSPAPPGLRFTDRSYFREALESGVFLVGDYTESRLSGRPVLPMAMPLQNPDGKTIGVLAAALDLGWLGDQLRERALPKNGSLTVADRNGVIIAREPLPERFVGTRIPDDFMHLVNAPEPGTMTVVSQDGTRRVIGYMPVGITPKNIYVSAGVSTDQEFAAIDRATQRGFALILAGLVLALSTAWAAGRYFISQPVMQLMGAVKTWQKGDYSVRASVPAGSGEFETLAAAFDRMVEEVAARQAERDRTAEALRDSEQRLREINATLEERITAALAERERSEAALRQSQRMQAIGQLTGGIAHDFNNLLTPVIGILDSLRPKLAGTDEQSTRMLDTALTAANRAATLIRRLLAFARHQRLDPKVVTVNAVVADLEDLLRRTLGEDISIETSLSPDLWLTEIDTDELENAILNLAINARDAMPSGGSLTLTTANIRLEPGDIARDSNAEIVPGDYVKLSIADTGTGMPAEIAARVFEPFFTTKEPGRGTGLGLSQVYGFIRQSGGHVKIESQPGAGTEVTICLPRTTKMETTPAFPATQAPPNLASGNETILVVEDDELVRLFVVETLQDLGCTVLEARDGPTALKLVEDTPDLDLLLTDIGLPGMTGWQLLAAVRSRRPDVKILLTTGYGRNCDPDGNAMDDNIHLLSKPFTAAALTRTVREILAVDCHAPDSCAPDGHAKT
jgi:signal transduction histidine kinase/ActR/RegA family two-component response regulator